MHTLVYVCMCLRALRWCVCVAVLCIQNKSSKSKLSCKQAATPTPRTTRRPVERSAHSWPRCCTHRECESEIVLHRERQSRIPKGRRKKKRCIYLLVYGYICSSVRRVRLENDNARHLQHHHLPFVLLAPLAPSHPSIVDIYTYVCVCTQTATHISRSLSHTHAAVT